MATKKKQITEAQLKKLVGWDKPRPGTDIQIWDTNALMDAAANPGRFHATKGSSLVAIPPFAVVELATNGLVSPDSAEKVRKKLAAARFAFANHDLMLPQGDRMIGVLVGLRPQIEMIVDAADFHLHLEALSKFTLPTERNDDQDFKLFENVKRAEYTAWKDAVAISNRNIREHIAQSPVMALKKFQQTKMAKQLQEPFVFWQVMSAMFEAVAGSGVQKLLETVAADGRMSEVVNALYPYISIYSEYHKKIASTGKKPQENDKGDLELFKYLGLGDLIFPSCHWTVVTSDAQWHENAAAAGFGKQVQKLV